MEEKRHPHQPEEKRDFEAESLIKNDERIRKICSTVGIQAIHCIETDKGKHVNVVPKGRPNPQLCIYVELKHGLTPAQIVRKVHSALRILVDRPIMFEATKHCNKDLTAEAMGDEEMPGKSDDQILWKLAKTYDGDCKLIHAWYNVTRAIEYFEHGRMAGDFRRAMEIEQSIDERLTNGSEMIAYWWRLDDNTGNELHVVYAGNNQENSAARNEEAIAYAVLREELYQALSEENLSDAVLIVEEDDARKGVILSSTRRQRKYDSPFGSSTPELTTSVNGIIIDEFAFSTFINQLKGCLQQQRDSNEEPGITIVIGDYAYADDSDDGDFKVAQSLDWKLNCYTRLPDVEDSNDEESIQEWNEKMLKTLLKEISEKFHPHIKSTVVNAITIKDEIGMHENPTYVQITWSVSKASFAHGNIEAVAGKILSAFGKSRRGQRKINVAIESSPSEEDDDIINLTIAISVGDDDHE